jgi:hypothetical protein
MPRSSEAELMDLFTSLFSAEALRRWASLAFGREVADALPGPGTSLAELAFQLALVLGQRGLVDHRLFARLSEERPGRRDEILRVARVLDLHRSRDVRALDDDDTSRMFGRGGGVELRDPSPTVQPAGPAGPAIRVLHLSDFHFRASTTWDASTVLGRLAVDIGRMTRQGLAPDLIVLTGDIAYSGKAAEYDLARAWITSELLPAAKLGVDRLVIVPGNHDADRSRVDFVAQQIGKGIRDERSQQRVTEVLDGDGGALLLRRLAAFMEFVNALGVAGAPLVRPWYRATFELDGIKLHCAAMASSWLSADDSDYGGLLLGLRQCNEVLKGADQADVVLVALHHPWDYVAEWDRRSSLAEIERSAGLILRGHLHEARHDYRQSVRHDGVLELAAGACYETSEHPNSYHLVELWPAAPRERRARVHVRSWDPARRDWRPELNAFGAPWGELPLRVRT